jgi:hypothetical protein
MTFLQSRRATAAVLALVLAAAAGGCSDGDESPAATNQTLFPPTPTTIGVDEIPDEITVEYVQRVVDVLDRSMGEMFRVFRRDGDLSEEVRQRLHAVYADDYVDDQEAGLQFLVDSGFERVVEQPGDPATRVERLIHADRDCIFFQASSDQRAWFEQLPDRQDAIFVAIEPRPDGPSEANPTSWEITYEMLRSEGEPGNVCES